MHRPKKELEDLIKKIEKDTDFENDERIKIMRKNLLNFLNNIVTEKINNREDGKDAYLKNIFDYKKALKREKIYSSTGTQRMTGFIEINKGAEYIIFGPLFSSEIEPESKKRDVAQGREKTLKMYHH